MLTAPSSSPDMPIKSDLSPFLTGFKFSMIQLLVGADKAANLLRAGRLVREAASKGAQVVALPVSDLHQHVTVHVCVRGYI